MLEIIENHIKKMKIPYTSITGAVITKDRFYIFLIFLNFLDNHASIALIKLRVAHKLCYCL